MNNPMRYAGKTFYQSGYRLLESGRETTTLQVVDNVGWMTPYVACMMVVVALVFHFGQTLLRYPQRRTRSTQTLDVPSDLNDEKDRESIRIRDRRMNAVSWIVTAALAATVLATFGVAAAPHQDKADRFHLTEFGKIPLWYQGRAMPLDSFARNELMKLSDRQTFQLDVPQPTFWDRIRSRFARALHPDAGSQQAIRWLTDLMADVQRAAAHNVVRIENDDVPGKRLASPSERVLLIRPMNFMSPEPR